MVFIPNNDSGIRELALFAGAGGGILGAKLLGHRIVCAVEIEPYCREVLLRRQEEGILEAFPIWDDVRTFDGKPWRGIADVVCGGFPCQDISVAGNGAGLEGERSGLWKEMSRIICEVRPRIVFVENSAALVVRGLGVVLRDLAKMGYDAKWGVFSASDVGAFHQRERIWIMAHAAQIFDSGSVYDGNGCEHKKSKRKLGRGYFLTSREQARRRLSEEWSESRVLRVVDGMANRVDRVGAVGNGQFPAVAKFAWEILST